MDKNVLFVCAGNTCRSPMAEFILKAKRPDLNVHSAGLCALKDFPMSRGAQLALKNSGFDTADISKFRSRQINQDDLKKDNIIFVMNTFIKDSLARMGWYEKVYVLGGKDIDDPYGKGLEDYQYILTIIENAIDFELKNRKGLSN